MKYRQLTREERYMISQLRRKGCSTAEIAKLMGRSRSTIYREVARNRCHNNDGAYRPSHAQERTNGRRRRSRQGSHYAAWQWQLIEELMVDEQWSPEQLSGVLRLEGMRISYQTIYRHIRREGSTPKSRTVVKGLRTSGLAWRPFVASSGCGTARCIRTHPPSRHRASGRSCGRPARA